MVRPPRSFIVEKVLLIGFMVLALSACSALKGRGQTDPEPGQVNYQDCQIGDGIFSITARCTTIEVYENREARTGRRIQLHIAVIPATSRSPLPDPLFFLAGGPGEAATESYATLSGAFRFLNLKRDIVLVDQRGTGRSHPLTCNEEENAEGDIGTTIQACLEAMDADPRFYTTAIAMDDLDEVRAALGYEHINLYGASYGTRAALIYARQHPEHLRSMILDGIAPIGWLLGPDGSKDAQRALDLIFARCGSKTACNSAFPNLAADFKTLQTNLSDSPATVELSDPQTGVPVTITMTSEISAIALQSLSYMPESAALIPLLVTEARRGNLAPLAAYALQRNTLQSSAINNGMYFSVVCSEDVPFYPGNLETNGYLGDATIELLLEICALWPHNELPADYLEPVQSNVPALLLSGEADPVTPPENGDLALRTLSNGRHLVLPGFGHISILRGCMPYLAREFIEAASANNLDITCLKNLSPMEFFVNFNGPVP